MSKKIAVRKRKILIAIAVMISIFFITAYLTVSRSILKDNMEYTVVPGVSISSVANDLYQGKLFKFLVLVNGNKIQVGTYDFPVGSSIWRMARMMARGQIASVAIVVPEGLTVKQIAKLLKDNKYLSGDNFGESHITYKDGELFPDTYIVAKGTDRNAVLDLMARKMVEIRTGSERIAKIPSPLSNWNDVVTLASIVQKETGKVSEMPIIASVYLNRLKKGMRLQADPTVVYAITNGLGDMQERKLWAKYLQIKNPFNTYKNFGLPPAPIANVGMDAIKAVLRPADTNYLYFVADGTGGHVFSQTLDQHNKFREVLRRIKNGERK